jgi:hypothetical protein
LPECLEDWHDTGARTPAASACLDALAKCCVVAPGKVVLDVARIWIDADVVHRVLHLRELVRGGGIIQDYCERPAARVEGMD